MEFYLELSNRIDTFRLQKDKSWRVVTSREIQDMDFLSPDVKEFIRLQEIDITLTIDGRKWKINPDGSTFGDKTILYYFVYTVRTIFPLIPSKEQLISVIKQGDDRINNSLILNVYGFFELRDFYTMNISIDDPTIAYRNETFGAGNDYVGEDAAKSQRHIDDLYLNSLSMWADHLESGRTDLYSDNITSKTLEEVIKRIKSFDIKKKVDDDY